MKDHETKIIIFFYDTLLSEENKKDYQKDPYVKDTNFSCFDCDTIAAGLGNFISSSIPISLSINWVLAVAR